MEELVQLCHSNKFKNKMFLIFMASLFSSAQPKVIETTLSLVFDLLIALLKTGLILIS